MATATQIRKIKSEAKKILREKDCLQGKNCKSTRELAKLVKKVVSELTVFDINLELLQFGAPDFSVDLEIPARICLVQSAEPPTPLPEEAETDASNQDKRKIRKKTRDILNRHGCFCGVKRKSTREVAKEIKKTMQHLTVFEIDVEVCLLGETSEFKVGLDIPARICLIA